MTPGKGCKESSSSGTCELRREVCEMKKMLQQQSINVMKLLKAAEQKAGPCEKKEDAACTVTCNPHLKELAVDHFHHLTLNTKTQNLQRLFGDVRCFVLGGPPRRMEKFAKYVMKEIGYTLHAGASLTNISECADRFAMYKAGPVVSVSHGMGGPSIGILLNELIKLCCYAKLHDPIFFRMGTSGGIDLPPGTLVVTEEALNAQLQATQEIVVMGKSESYPTNLDKKLAEQLRDMCICGDNFSIMVGKTLSTNDFYEGQARLDGAFCDYSADQRLAYLNDLNQKGVLNIEMESTMFAALTNRAKIRSAVVCVTLLNRLLGDQINIPHEALVEYQERPGIIIARYIKKLINGGFDEPEKSTTASAIKVSVSVSEAKHISINDNPEQ